MIDTVAACQRWAQEHGLERGDVMSLMQSALGVSASWLRAHDTDVLAPEVVQAIVGKLARRLEGEPVAYINGEKEFYGLRFQIDKRVLIPRPETELLVDFVRQHTPDGARLADIGTGSGAIALALAAVRPDLQILACDISEDALELARSNAVALKVMERVQFCQGHLLSALANSVALHEPLQCIVSNPPYIEAEDAHLGRGDLRFEPVRALTDGFDGLSLIRELITQAPGMLQSGAWLVLEHGFAQGAAIRELLGRQGSFDSISTHVDLAGLDRMTVAKKFPAS
jgi:release factor glutamine methyltransferase